jgi:hypothetical protein
MQTALRMETIVLPGHRVEITAPELIVVLPHAGFVPRTSMVELLKTLPPGPRGCDTWEEYERILQEEKNAWE